MIQKFTIIFCLLVSCFFASNGQTVSKNANNIVTFDAELLQAKNLINQGQLNEAIKILQSELVKRPNNIMLNYWLGKAFYKQGIYKNAVDNLVLGIKSFTNAAPEYKEAVQMLGLSHYLLGHLAESIPYLEQLVVWNPENSELTYALGICYIQTRNPIRSREIYARLFGVSVNSPSAFLLNAQMHVRQRFEETAEIELIQALKLDPKLPQANFILGELAIYKAEIDKGIIFLKKEIELNPANGMAYYRLGEALSRQLKWDESIQPLQKSIWLNPFFSGPYIVLGKVYFKKDDLGNAENLLRRAVSMDTKNFSAHHLLAQVLQKAGKIDDAKKEFEIAEQLRGNADKEQ